MPVMESIQVGKPRILTRDTGIVTMSTRDIAERIIRVTEIMRNLVPGYRVYQRVFAMRIIEALIEHDENEYDGEITGLFARQSGKTEVTGPLTASLAIMLPLLSEWFPDDWRFNLTSEEGMYQGYKHGLMAGIYAPVKDQARTTFERIQQCYSSNAGKEILDELGITFSKFNGNEILMSNGSIIRCGTASVSSNIESKTYHIVIEEECQKIPDIKIEKSIDPMVAAFNGLIVKVGTCDVQKANFYRSIERNKRAYEQGLTAKRNNFYFPADIVEKYNSSYRITLAKARRKYGVDSTVYRLSYLCLWLLDEGQFTTVDKLFDKKVMKETGPFSYLWDCAEANTITVNRATGKVHKWRISAGIDFAKVNDSTVVALAAVDWGNPLEGSGYFMSSQGEVECNLYQKHLVGLMELKGVDYETQFYTIKDYLSYFKNLDKIVVDSNGVGSSIADRMSAAYQVEVEHFNTASTPLKSSAQLYYQQELHSGRFTLPWDETAQESELMYDFTNQHLDAVKNIRNGYITFAHPDTEGAKDDHFDAATMSVWGTRLPASGLEVQVFDGNIFQLARR